jgi:uncharacterized protein YecE (DUF72 family)
MQHTMDRLPVARVGCAGWSIPKHTASQFPEGTSHLHRYSQLLDCCEINSSFHRGHKIETWKRWAESVPANFRFSVKLPRAITHEAKLDGGPELLVDFLNQIRYLGDKLGPILVQLPPSFNFERSKVVSFLSLLRRHYVGNVVCEPRHSSWFTAQVDRVLEGFAVSRVASDPACVPAASEPGGTLALTYFRFHGSPRRYYSAYTDEFLDAVSLKVKKLVTRAEVWCVFDNTVLGAASSNAIELTSKLRTAKLPG